MTENEFFDDLQHIVQSEVAKALDETLAELVRQELINILELEIIAKDAQDVQ